MKTAITTASIIILFTSVSCRKTEPAIEDLSEWTGKPAAEMIAEFGKPTQEHSYTISQAPTKGWNHRIIFSVYPKDVPQNADVVITEYAWDRNDYTIRACCHQVENTWLVMGAMKIHKDVRF